MTATVFTLKQKAHALIDQLPEDATWHDMAEALAVVEDIEAGLIESDAGEGVETAALRKRFGLSERRSSGRRAHSGVSKTFTITSPWISL